ncbi:MAG: Fur family transcriptional regulator [Pseudomonadota bacterium]
MSIGFEAHNHDACVATGVAQAQAYCAKEGLKMTPTRQRVLEILLRHHRAFGAYDILEELRNDGLGSQPPVVYRALDFLIKHGFAHKLERLNAFVACSHPGQDHAPAFLICNDCGSVAETQTSPEKSQLREAARKAGFTVEATVLEADGTCPLCTTDGSPA